MSALPSAAILVLNHNGRHHLEACLPSLAAVDYPNASVVVVDNGSTDGSLEWLRQTHPRVQVLALGSNHGFAPAYNIAVRQSAADIVVLLNNDTRVEPAWLRALVDTMTRHDAAAASSVMLDWDGRHIDFAGALPTFIGHAWQVDHGLPIGRPYTEQRLLFGCAGSLAVRRSAFLHVDGFDDDFFAYFEDLDLGWRMSLAGLPTVLAPSAITHHRLHGTARGWGHTLRLRLYERNALFATIKNFGNDAAARIVPAAITLTLARALAHAGLDRNAVRFGHATPDLLGVPPSVIATLLALEDVARALPALRLKRERVQASRRVSDDELFALFPEPLKLHAIGHVYQEAAEALIRDLRIDELFGTASRRTLVPSAVEGSPASRLDALERPSVSRLPSPASRLPSPASRLPALSGVEGPSALSGVEGPSALSGVEGQPPASRLPALSEVDGLAALSGVDGLAALSGVEGLAALSGVEGRVRPGVVSVIVLTASGARHLPECLDSLRAHAWPGDRTEVIVVDNGSTEDPTPVAERHYPGVRVVRTHTNLGFSGGNNAGARVATGEWLVFLNDDTRVEPRWLDEMMDVASRRGAASVGAFITDWEGARVDFAGGLVNLEGRGFSLGYDLAVDDADLDERPLLFGCGAAVLFNRAVFEASGGWDEPTFAYYEDVEFGWRLWLLGHEVWFAPRAVVRHKHHGTSGAESPARLRAFERNALRMLYSLLDEEHLQQVLPAALLLAADRALLATPFSRAFDGVKGPRQRLAERLRPGVLKIRLLHALSRRGARRQYGTLTNLRRVGMRGLLAALGDVTREMQDGWDSPGARMAYLIEHASPSSALEAHVERLPAAVAAQLLGLGDFIHMLPELSARRQRLQSARRRSDAEILDRFGAYWTNLVPSPHHHLHAEVHKNVMEGLGLGPRS
ncbi:MAG: glycosyltransferase family 2 protein [Acidobacteria bacterium]|nr:glycosyltransferase family 2 protein [Acidobacteriota bacterium]